MEAKEEHKSVRSRRDDTFRLKLSHVPAIAVVANGRILDKLEGAAMDVGEVSTAGVLELAAEGFLEGRVHELELLGAKDGSIIVRRASIAVVSDLLVDLDHDELSGAFAGVVVGGCEHKTRREEVEMQAEKTPRRDDNSDLRQPLQSSERGALMLVVTTSKEKRADWNASL